MQSPLFNLAKFTPPLPSFALFLGAGFSKWAADLPVASQLFDFSILHPWQREQKRLELVKQLKFEWDKQNEGGFAEQFIAYALDLPDEQRRAVLWYICRRLTDPFIHFNNQGWRRGRHVPMFGEVFMQSHPGIMMARRFLRPFCGLALSGIITTNYDLLIEQALGNSFHYGIANEVIKGVKSIPSGINLTRAYKLSQRPTPKGAGLCESISPS